jgi:hypothetical protein
MAELLVDDLKHYFSVCTKFSWGGLGGEDCMTFCATWVSSVLGQDPAESFRGTYSTEEEAHLLAERHGGMVAFADELLLPIGLRRTLTPRTGDVGIINVPYDVRGNTKDVAAIRFGPLWAFMSPVRVVARRVDNCVASWRVT